MVGSIAKTRVLSILGFVPSSCSHWCRPETYAPTPAGYHSIFWRPESRLTRTQSKNIRPPRPRSSRWRCIWIFSSRTWAVKPMVRGLQRRPPTSPPPLNLLGFFHCFVLGPGGLRKAPGGPGKARGWPGGTCRVFRSCQGQQIKKPINTPGGGGS